MTYEEFKGAARDYEYPDGMLQISWSGGGSYGNCWNDSMYHSSPEQEPEFSQLDELLEALVPGLTFLQYKGVMRLVETRDEFERDYYGGGGTTFYKTIQLRTLYDYLVEKDLLK